MTILIVTAVAAERVAIADRMPDAADVRVVEGGIGRTNAAACTTEQLLTKGPFHAVISAGVAGSLPPIGDTPPPAIGTVLVATECVYAEEGLASPDGLVDVAAMGLSLGDFTGNRVPVDQGLLQQLRASFPAGPIATVATCSGTDQAALRVARRTGAIAEAMEGAAVVHAARRLGVPAIELRAVSNRTGDRAEQRWDLSGALAALGSAADRAIRTLLADRGR